MFNKATTTSFILGFLTSVMLTLAFFAGQQHAPTEVDVALKNQQILLDTKVHLVEMKVDVITEQKETEELQSDYDHIMDVLVQSHQYTGEGIIARDKAMREAAHMINEEIVAGGRSLVESIEKLLEEIEKHLHHHEEEITEEENESGSLD